MWPEHPRGWRHRWRGFEDPLGERFVLEAVSGLRTEGLVLQASLTREPALFTSLSRSIAEFSDIRHPGLRPPRELHRTTGADRTPVVVSDYTAGMRLGSWLDQRKGVPPPTAAVLHIAQQVGAALLAIADHAPGLVHGLVGLDRIVLTPDGRVVLVEAGLSPVLEPHTRQAPEGLWQRYRVAMPFSPHLEPFGPATDAGQLGVLVLELLLGRRLRPDEYPSGLARLLGSAQETDLVGGRVPLGTPLFEWLTLTLGLDMDQQVATMPLTMQAFDRLLSDGGGYIAAPVEMSGVAEALELLPFPTETTVPLQAAPADSWNTRPREQGPSTAVASGIPEEPVAQQPAPEIVLGFEHRVTDTRTAPTSSTAKGPTWETGAAAWSPSSTNLFSSTVSGQTLHEPRTRSLSIEPGYKRRWSRSVKWGLIALAATIVLAAGTTGWRYWRERHIGQETGTLQIESAPPGATILIDGIERGKAPLTLAVMPGRHDVTAKSSTGIGSATTEVQVGERRDVTVPLTFGTDPGYIDITSDPQGALVTLDGTRRGRAPLSIEEVPPGEHVLVVAHGNTSLERRFTLGPAERLTLYVPLAGWVAVRSAVPVDVLERGRTVGSSSDGRLLVPAGRRRLQFVNNELGVNSTQDVIVRAGQIADVNVPLSQGTLSVSADVTAEVWVDGLAAGRTPTGNISVAIGEHEVLVSHPEWGEQRLTVIVGLGAPTRLSIKLSSPKGKSSQRVSSRRSGISAAR